MSTAEVSEPLRKGALDATCLSATAHLPMIYLALADRFRSNAIVVSHPVGGAVAMVPFVSTRSGRSPACGRAMAVSWSSD